MVRKVRKTEENALIRSAVILVSGCSGFIYFFKGLGYVVAWRKELSTMEEVLKKGKESVILEEDLEGEFLSRLLQGDASAFQEVVARYQRGIFGFCLRMIGNVAEAEDLAQEVFLRAFRSIRRFRGQSKFSTWLYQIARNLSLNRIRYLRRRRTSDLQSVSMENEASLAVIFENGEIDSPEGAVLEQERRRHLSEAIVSLDILYREVILLRDVEGLSYEEISEALGTAVGTVKSRLHRARMELLKQMKKRGML
ncbi:MAG: sigma-70 family RNA polymerase sigma factor [Deltaproteobacteria bacterium]|nr:sigma-70 family RNA polymerase sigma factor [Deltaproteobacteria bacterium]